MPKPSLYRGLAIAVVHFSASVAAFLWNYVASASAFAFDGREMSWVSRNFARPLFEALWFPLGTGLAPYLRSDLLLYGVVLLNSLCWSAVVLVWRYRVAAALLFLSGAYAGMNAYAYGFGGSEHRVWAALGAVSSLHQRWAFYRVYPLAPRGAATPFEP